MAERTKAFRRSCEKKAKIKAKKSIMAEGLDERGIGVMASTHCKPCSCEMCGNPRKFFGERTLREKRSDLSMNDE